MIDRIRNILLTLLALALLAGFAVFTPSPVITQEAADSYWADAGSEDDEYAFLFGE